MKLVVEVKKPVLAHFFLDLVLLAWVPLLNRALEDIEGRPVAAPLRPAVWFSIRDSYRMTAQGELTTVTVS